jgi:hypothetical protein
MSTEKPKRGRPKKFVDLELVEKLAHIQCTYGEIAATLGVSVDTLQRNKNFAVVYKKGAEGGRKSLRRMQFEAANKGNVTMQIWLGKQYLSQSDHGLLEVRQASPFRDLKAQDLRTVLAGYAKKYPQLFREMNLDAEFSVVEPQPLVRPTALLESNE